MIKLINKLLFLPEKNVTAMLYRQQEKVVVWLAGLTAILYGFRSLEYYNNLPENPEIVLNALAQSSLSIICILIYNKKRNWFRSFVMITAVLSAFCDIEQFVFSYRGDVLNEYSMAATLGVILFFLAMVLPVNSIEFFTIAFIDTSYFFVRLIANFDLTINRIHLGTQLYIAMFISLGIQIAWLRIRYNQKFQNLKLADANEKLTKLTGQKNKLIQQLKKSKQKALEEQKARLAAENALQIKNERKQIYGDIHDHIGARLTDLLFQIDNLQNEVSGIPKEENDLRKDIQQIIHDLRNRIHTIDEENLLEKDFTGGMHLALVRRYSCAGRELFFEVISGEDEINEKIAICGKMIRKELYTAIQEMITNDLKYGCGESRWEIGITENNSLLISLHSTAGTLTKPKIEKGGFGHLSIQNRLDRINGTIQENLSGEFYQMSIQMPFPDPLTQSKKTTR